MPSAVSEPPGNGDVPAFAAYGLALRNVGLGPDTLVPADESWPALEILREVGQVSPGLDRLSDRRAEIGLQAGGRVKIEREPLQARFETLAPLTDVELVHPFLAPVAAIASRWLGRESFHAGAFVSDGGAWALIGERGAGKSSMLAWLALGGAEIVADDVLVVDQRTAFAGPRSIDLRAEPAARLQAGEHLGRVGRRERWRLGVGPVAPQLPLRGWILLGWGDRVEARRIPGGACLAEVARHRAVRVPPTRPEVLLELAALPAWELRRPQRWESLSEAVRVLLEAIGDPRELAPPLHTTGTPGSTRRASLAERPVAFARPVQ